jgi:hypothetical protein
MSKKEVYYCLGTLEDRKHIRFAREFAHWQPIALRWQPYYLKHFIGIGGDKKQLPYPLTLKKDTRTEEILVLEFMYHSDMPLEFRTDYDHWILFVLVELSSKERVIVSCC